MSGAKGTESKKGLSVGAVSSRGEIGQGERGCGGFSVARLSKCFEFVYRLVAGRGTMYIRCLLWYGISLSYGTGYLSPVARGIFSCGTGYRISIVIRHYSVLRRHGVSLILWYKIYPRMIRGISLVWFEVSLSYGLGYHILWYGVSSLFGTGYLCCDKAFSLSVLWCETSLSYSRGCFISHGTGYQVAISYGSGDIYLMRYTGNISRKVQSISFWCNRSFQAWER